MECRIALVGWTGELPRGAARWERVRPEPGAVALLAKLPLVVLGDNALTALDPRTVARQFGGSDTRLLLCPVRCPYDVLVPWTLAGIGALTTPELLAGELNEAVAASARPRLAPPEWLGDDQPDAVEVRHALAALERLERFSVLEWAGATGRSRHGIARMCERRFGVSASEILWRYVAATGRKMRRDGVAVAHIADALGYSEASALVRAFRRRGTRLDAQAAGGPPAKT